MKSGTKIYWLALLGVVLSGCPSEPTSDDTGPALDADPPSSRTYALGIEPLGYAMQGTQRWVFDDTAWLSPDVTLEANTRDNEDTSSNPLALAEILVVPAYLEGIPWAEFGGADDSPQNLPGAWLARMQGLRDAVMDSGLRLVLALSPMNMRYDNLAAKVVTDGSGGDTLQDNWLNEYCPNTSAGGNPDKWPVAYARYVSWMVELFSPEFVSLGHRVNLFEENCGQVSPGSYESMVGFATTAHQRIKERHPEVLTIVGVDIEDLYGYPRTPGRCVSLSPKECFEERRQLIGPIVADRVGLASYPALAVASLKELPGDWLSYIYDALGGQSAVITGLGMPGRSVEEKSGVCVPFIESDEGLQRDLLDQAVAIAGQESMDFIVWSFATDLFDADAIGSCSCSGPKDLCDHLDQLGASADSVRPTLIQGLYDKGGARRQAGELWHTLLEQ